MRELRKTVPIPAGRLIAISDVHGNLSLLKALFEKLDLRPEDRLVFVGDMTDKGPASLPTLRFIMELCRSGKAFCVPGNCDACGDTMRRITPEGLFDYLEQRRTVWEGRSLLWEMAREQEFLPRSPSEAAALRDALLREYAEEFAFLDELPFVLECGAFRFVHAGLSSDDPAAWDPKRCLRWDAFLESTERFSKTVVVGHWPVTLYSRNRLDYGPVFDRERRVIAIDGANVLHHFGQLNALVIGDASDPDSVSWTWEDGFPLCMALDQQEPSETSRAVYFNEPMELLERRGELSLCRVRSDGYTLEVPTAHLWERNGSVFASGESDYRLRVEPGERLTLLLSCGGRYMLKRDGVAGWYDGEVRV